MGDLPGLRVAPLAFAVEHGEAVWEVRRDGVRGKFMPLGIGQRLAPVDAATEKQLGNQHPLFRRQQAGVRSGLRQWERRLRRRRGAAAKRQ